MRALEINSSGWAVGSHPLLPSHHARHSLSRRAFIGGAAGAAGAVLGSGLLWPGAGLAATLANSAPKPTTNTTTLNGVSFHFSAFGPTVDPSSITDFTGFIGVADVQGNGVATNPDGTKETLLFDTDMRFMKGRYVGQDGAVHRGTFGFVWLDLYRGRYDFTNFSTQVHDFDTGITPYPNGLFWTVPLRSHGDHDRKEDHDRKGEDGPVSVDLRAGTARLAASNLSSEDFFNIPNALFRFQSPASVDATTSFDIRWSGPVTSRSPVTTPGSSGELLLNQATMTWSAKNASGFKFRSNPSPTTSFFAQLGHVSNGIFFGRAGND